MSLIQLMRSKHIHLLFLIFFILSVFSSFLWLLNDALKQQFNFTASEVLGADGTIESTKPLPQHLNYLAEINSVKLSQTINFTSMAITGKGSVLAHIRAIEHTFPLKGEVKIKTNLGIFTHTKLGPNQLWIDEALKTRLKVNLFDTIQLGKHNFQLAGIIQAEPARAGTTFMLAPKMMMRLEDVEKTGLIQPYSKILYQSFVQGEDQYFAHFIQQIKSQYSELKIYTVKEGRPFANTIFSLAERYIGIFIVLTVMLSGMGMMVLSEAFSSDMIVTVALLKTFGYGLKDIIPWYFMAFLLLGLLVITASLGVALGGVALLSHFYPDYIIFNLSYLSSLAFGKIVLIQVISSLVVLFGFGFFPIIQTFKISPMYLFRKEVGQQSTWLIYLAAEGVKLILLLLYIQNYVDVLIIFGYILVATIALNLFFYGVLSGGIFLPTNYIKILTHSRKRQNSALMTKFGVVFLLAGLLWVIFNDFFGNWLLSIPHNAPNQFMINITDNNKNQIQQFWHNKNIDLTLSPMLTAQLKQVNNQVKTFHRPLNISYTNHLPADNNTIKGSPWDSHLTGQAVISIEQNFAKNIQAQLGDTLTFDVGGQEISGKIINIRNLKWESFKPNFYVIFPEKVLNYFPKTYISSIYLPENQLPLTHEFLKKFPSISLIDVNLSLDQVKGVLLKVVMALKYVMLVILLLAGLVYYAIIAISFFERQYESALLRSFGASRQQLSKLILVEFGLIGAVSGGCGMLGAIILAMLLSKQLSITYHPNWLFILVGIALGALLTTIIGWLATYKVVKVSPLMLLKEGA